MTDPRCPYCGHRMELFTELTELHKFWYECPDCMCTGPMKDTADDALAAAHQRYTPPAQPLTLAELLALERPWPLWVERVGYQLTPMILYTSYSASSDKILTLNNLTFDAASYNRTWRCWLNKPTGAEREAAVWDGGADP